MNETKSLEIKTQAVGKVTDPKDFSEGGGEHRKSIIASTSLIIVLAFATETKPALLGVTLDVTNLWIFICISHLYFFVMWRITGPIEADSEKHFWNIQGLIKQAFLKGTKNFPGKMKAQLFFIRALPIWAFFVGLAGVVYGFCKNINA